MGFLKPPKAEAVTPPAAPPVPPPFISQQKPQKKKSTVPTFLGAEATPEMGTSGMGGGKTLLGQ